MFIYFLNPSEDIYLFGGKAKNQDGTVTSSNEIHKLSIGEWDAADIWLIF